MGRNVIPGVSNKTFVVEGATLRCSLGTQSSSFTLPVGHGVFIHGKKQANIKDMTSMVHLPSFGTCTISSPPTPCVPAVAMDWLSGKEDVLVEDSPALLNTSMAVCSRGGIITITEDGQRD